MNEPQMKSWLSTALTGSSLLSATVAALVLVMAPRSAARDVVVAVCLSWSLLVHLSAPASPASTESPAAPAEKMRTITEALAFGLVPSLWIAARHDPLLPLLVAAVAYAVTAVLRVARAGSNGAVIPAAAVVCVVAVAVDAVVVGTMGVEVFKGGVVEAAAAGVAAVFLLMKIDLPRTRLVTATVALLALATLAALIAVASP